MANMSYCRFRNTMIDLADCVYTLENIRNGEEEPLSSLSSGEYSASKMIYDLCQEYIQLFEELQEEDAERHK